MINVELTILMPCLNEAETLRICIDKAKKFLHDSLIDGEVLVADNGSIDGSIEIAKKCGARVIHISEKGYGNALRAGTDAAIGKYIIMGDADDSYDFLELMPFVEKLREGYELVMGNRFRGGIENGAMPWLHRYLGNPVLSFTGRLFFHSKIGDFHCGLRGYNKESIQKLNLHTTGMEYASEMVVMAELNGLKIAEVPTTLVCDGRSGKPHLRSFRDGWRHLKFLFMYSPNWLFLYPGIIFFVVGMIISIILLLGQVKLLNVVFSIHTLLYSMIFMDMGLFIIEMFLIVKIYAYNSKFLPQRLFNWSKKIDEDAFIFIGLLIIAIGIVLTIMAFVSWKNTGFSALVPEDTMRIAIPAVGLLIAGVQTMFAGFMMGIMKIKSQSNR